MGSDSETIDLALELVAERCEDITPHAFDRFFADRPDARSYFQLSDVDAMARGRMLVEVIGLIRDIARGEAYVLPTMSTMVADHVSYGVAEPALYEAFLNALRSVFAELLGPLWTRSMAEAWERQSLRLLQTVPKAVRAARAAASPRQNAQ